MELIKKNWKWMWRVTILLILYFGLPELWDRLYGEEVKNSPTPTSYTAPAAHPQPQQKRTVSKPSLIRRPCRIKMLELAPPADTLHTFHGIWEERGDVVTFSHRFTFQIPGQAAQQRKVEFTFNIITGEGSWEIHKPWANEHGKLVMGETKVDEWIGVRYIGQGTEQPDERFKVTLQ